MEYFIQGQGSVKLGKREYVASGGEGTVYAKGSEAYKIYHDPSKMIPRGKVDELRSIQSNKVIKPLNYILDKKKNIVGYSMRYVTNTFTLCQLFPIVFKNRNNLGANACFDLALDMRSTIQRIHDASVLLVDLNEMNFLVDENFQEVYFIDTDSYQTQTYPATAIMESIRDRHTPIGDFNTGSDWFSFAVVSFQLLTGIHPYKGKHPTVKTMDDRMKQNISVFHKDVRIPKSCGSFQEIPPAWFAWYSAVFDKGQRIAPPSDRVNVITVKTTKVITDDNALEIRKSMVDYAPNSARKIYTKTTKRQRPVEILCDGGRVFFEEPHGPSISMNQGMFAEQLMEYDDRTYVRMSDAIYEVDFIETRSLVPKLTPVTKILPNATRMYDGVVIQALLGQCYASVYPKSKKAYQIKIEELSGYRISDAKFEKNVLMIVASQNGVYDKFIITFSDLDREEYSIEKVEDISMKDINFTVLDKGILVHINDEEKLELSHPNMSEKKVIESDALNMNMKLFSRGNQVYFYSKGDTYSLKTK